MSFITDKQTLEDLNILGKFKTHSMFSLFNQVQTAGGERLLNEMFCNPLSEAAEINQRSRLFHYFQEKAYTFPFTGSLFGAAENYFSMATAGSRMMATAAMLRRKLMKVAVRDEQYDQVHSELLAAIEMLNRFSDFLKQPEQEEPFSCLSPFHAVKNILADQRLQWLSSARKVKQLSLLQMGRFHHLLLHVLRNEMEDVLQAAYFLDVCIAVSKVAVARGFSYAQALPQEANCFHTSALHHPGLDKAVPNPVRFDQNENLLFLTGANMAGKSTLMKSFGIAVYMAHMGFPVAAKDLVFSVREGLYTSINVPDNLNMGYSHFYAEVLRVQQVAKEVAAGKDLVVIFDELFKGTNVKDAYDATLAVTAAFAAYRNCFFIISTHIIEVAEPLRHHGNHICFAYMPTEMEGVTPVYTYQLTNGITNDRQGMLIIENEGIVAMLHGVHNRETGL
jgi:DNA mismatch repair ATPase MutS